MPLITLTTDFGDGSYVAQIKGVLLSALPEARIVDVTHAVPPYSVRHAEVVLRGTGFAFPVGTVHLVVVDPGVGSARRPIAVRARGMTFVGPDNGVLGLALKQPEARVVALDRSDLFREPISPTFHGRDVFAPVAAELAAGLELDQVGTPISDPVASTIPDLRVTSTEVGGETLVSDRFGNLLTNVPAGSIGAGPVWIAGRATRRVQTYAEASCDELLNLAGSDGYIEIAMREASAADALGGGLGLEVLGPRRATV